MPINKNGFDKVVGYILGDMEWFFQPHNLQYIETATVKVMPFHELVLLIACSVDNT
jgi:hypothetical protein